MLLTTQVNYAPFISRKVVPGMTEDRPPSRVNFSECLYAKIFDLFARAKSWQQRWRMLWLSRLDRDDSTGRAKLFISRKVIPTRMINGANQKLVPRVFSFSYRRHIGNERTLGTRLCKSPFWPSQLFCLFCKWFTNFGSEKKGKFLWAALNLNVLYRVWNQSVSPLLCRSVEINNSSWTKDNWDVPKSDSYRYFWNIFCAFLVNRILLLLRRASGSLSSGEAEFVVVDPNFGEVFWVHLHRRIAVDPRSSF